LSPDQNEPRANRQDPVKLLGDGVSQFTPERFRTCLPKHALP